MKLKFSCNGIFTPYKIIFTLNIMNIDFKYNDIISWKFLLILLSQFSFGILNN